jgi:hypothetical protein
MQRTTHYRQIFYESSSVSDYKHQYVEKFVRKTVRFRRSSAAESINIYSSDSLDYHEDSSPSGYNWVQEENNPSCYTLYFYRKPVASVMIAITAEKEDGKLFSVANVLQLVCHDNNEEIETIIVMLKFLTLDQIGARKLFVPIIPKENAIKNFSDAINQRTIESCGFELNHGVKSYMDRGIKNLQWILT